MTGLYARSAEPGDVTDDPPNDPAPTLMRASEASTGVRPDQPKLDRAGRLRSHRKPTGQDQLAQSSATPVPDFHHGEDLDQTADQGSEPTPPPQRRASVQRALGGQSTAMRGMIAMAAVVIVGGIYLFTPVFGGWNTPVKQAYVANPLVPDQRVGTGLMVAAPVKEDDGARDPLIAATAPDVALLPDVQSTNGDIDGLLARLDERQARLDKLAGQLNEAARARDAAKRDIDRLTKDLKAAKLSAATERKTHEAEIRALKQQHKLEMARAVADAMAKMPAYQQQPVDTGLSPEELRLLEERRRLRAAQLRSKSIVYDGVTD